MKISFIAENDFANVLTEYAYCINKHSKDIEAKSICFRPHPFNYTLQHDYDLHFCSEEHKLEAKQFIKESDVIIFGEEGNPLEPTYRTLREFSNLLGLDLINSEKKLCIWHPGTLYRENSNFYNKHPLRNKIYKHLYTLGNYKLSPKSEIDYPLLQYQYNNFTLNTYLDNFNQKLNREDSKEIFHNPSNPLVKGTYDINRVIKELKIPQYNLKYNWVTNITHSQSIQRKQNSLIYIDQFTPQFKGGYGISALEAIFNSNIALSTIDPDASEAFYKMTGSYNIPVVPLGNSIEEMKYNLHKFFTLSKEDLYQEAYNKGKWIDTYLNPNFITQFILKLID
tara:strand:- start:1469 stop:2482 length:1014 start_codon:yes stop_codon:yes gene_type:complete